MALFSKRIKTCMGMANTHWRECYFLERGLEIGLKKDTEGSNCV